MKILHTSDWHVDLHAAQLADAASTVRAARWNAVERLVQIAEENDVDLVLVAGDTFDTIDADDATVARVVGLLNRFAPARVVVLPGNHDPLVTGGVWDRTAWSSLNEHVILATSAGPLEFLTRDQVAVTIYPCPIQQKQSRLDPTDDIPVRAANDQRLRIGLAHGSLDALHVAENFPIAQARAALTGLDYLALGDWHGQRIFSGCTAYSGTPEATSFGERRTGLALLVHLDDSRATTARIEPIRVGQCAWLQSEVELRDLTDLAELEADLLGLGAAEHALVRLQVKLVQDAVADAPDGADGSNGASGQEMQTSLLGTLAPVEDFGEHATFVDAVEAFRTKWQERLLYLDWRLSELSVSSSDLPRSLNEIDAPLKAALEGGELDGALLDLSDLDPAVLIEARWQLRTLASQTAS